MVVGIGLNVNWSETVPDELAGLAVALHNLRPWAAAVSPADLAVPPLTALSPLPASRPPGALQSRAAAGRGQPVTLSA